MKTYSVIQTIRLGIDDLKCIDAFVSSAQGHHDKSNNVLDYLNRDNWLIPVFTNIDYTNQIEVDKEIKKRQLWNLNYVKKLMKNKTFGKEIDRTISITLMEDERFDSYPKKSICENYKYKIIDFK